MVLTNCFFQGHAEDTQYLRWFNTPSPLAKRACSSSECADDGKLHGNSADFFQMKSPPQLTASPVSNSAQFEGHWPSSCPCYHSSSASLGRTTVAQHQAPGPAISYASAPQKQKASQRGPRSPSACRSKAACLCWPLLKAGLLQAGGEPAARGSAGFLAWDRCQQDGPARHPATERELAPQSSGWFS